LKSNTFRQQPDLLSLWHHPGCRAGCGSLARLEGGSKLGP